MAVTNKQSFSFIYEIRRSSAMACAVQDYFNLRSYPPSLHLKKKEKKRLIAGKDYLGMMRNNILLMLNS